MQQELEHRLFEKRGQGNLHLLERGIGRIVHTAKQNASAVVILHRTLDNPPNPQKYAFMRYAQYNVQVIESNNGYLFSTTIRSPSNRTRT